MIRVAQGARLDVRRTLRLVDGDMDTLAGCTDGEVLAYIHALHARAARRAGQVPANWTSASRCEGCGPVWLWPDAPLHVIACPWCWNRIAGLPVPSPLAAF
jgi:hypothetical protein